jgi:hypothetical protein
VGNGSRLKHLLGPSASRFSLVRFPSSDFLLQQFLSPHSLSHRAPPPLKFAACGNYDLGASDDEDGVEWKQRGEEGGVEAMCVCDESVCVSCDLGRGKQHGVGSGNRASGAFRKRAAQDQECDKENRQVDAGLARGARTGMVHYTLQCESTFAASKILLDRNTNIRYPSCM